MLEINFDETCPICADALKAIDIETKRIDRESYGPVNMVTMELSPSFIIRPDRNSSGIVTHWHITRGII